MGGYPDTGYPPTGYPDTGYPPTGYPDTDATEMTGYPETDPTEMTGYPDTGATEMTGYPSEPTTEGYPTIAGNSEVIVCEDASTKCEKFKKYCNMNDFVTQRCLKTCGVCKSAASELCEDESTM